MARALLGLAQAVQLQPNSADLIDAEDFPEARQHHDQFGIDVRSRKAHRLDVDLMELPVAPALRPLVAEHGAYGPQPARRLVGKVVLDDRTHHTGGELGAEREVLAIQAILERVHLLLDDVGDLADALHEELGVLDDRRTDLLVAVAPQPVGHAGFEPLPQRRLAGEHVVHAPDT